MCVCVAMYAVKIFANNTFWENCDTRFDVLTNVVIRTELISHTYFKCKAEIPNLTEAGRIVSQIEVFPNIMQEWTYLHHPIENTSFSNAFLDAFAKLRKVTYLHVHLSVRVEQLDSHWEDFDEI